MTMADSIAPEPSAAPATDDGWVIAVPTDAPGRVTFSGATAESGPRRAFVAGRLFDRAALASASSLPPDTSDAALVLALWEREGDAGLARLRGKFAFALADQSSNRVLVGRDPLGTHPLFSAKTPQTIYFATAPQALIRQPGVSPAVNRPALADHLCRRWPHPHETFFEAVLRVSPGCLIEIVPGRIEHRRYWDPTPADRDIDWLDGGESELFNERLDQSVRRCLSLGTSGVFLSGGMDSVSIAAVAADCARRDGQPLPIALSLGFPDPEVDERPLQAAVASQLGLRHHLIDFWDAVGDRGLLAQSLELNRYMASPVLNTWGPAYHALARRGRQEGVEVILTGMGGDEWLTVTPRLAADLMWDLRLGDTLRFIRMMMRSQRFSRARVLRTVLWTFGLRPLGSRTLHRLAPAAWHRSRVSRQTRRDPSWVAPDQALRATMAQRAEHNLGPADPPMGFYIQELRSSLEHGLVSWELEEQYQFGRLLGVEVMHPYWDADLVDMLLRTRPEVLSRGGRSKGLVRSTLAVRFPDLGFARQRKLSATSFYRAVLKREGPAVLAACGGFGTLESLGVVNGAAALSVCQDRRVPESTRWSQAWNLVNLEAWVRAHGN